MVHHQADCTAKKFQAKFTMKVPQICSLQKTTFLCIYLRNKEKLIFFFFLEKYLFDKKIKVLGGPFRNHCKPHGS